MADLPTQLPIHPTEPAHRYRLRAPNIPETAKVAREMIAGLLLATGHPALVDTARLLVTEVVANVSTTVGQPDRPQARCARCRA
ncbi:hypothetical protein SAZ11_37300 [Streptomyces sp. FXJ1.4098]|uniref:hypothetical protein n=1 Tax=Streptomyces sp. NPDC020845 TaxID=3365096 RepID=UPI00299AAC80|nr:hypothetical protein [Streptomyces sp. FXJ1.4098]